MIESSTDKRIFGYGAFLLVVAAMIGLSVALRGFDVQATLFVTEAVCILGPAIILHLVCRDAPTWEFPSLRRLGMHPGWLVWVVVTAAFLGLAANVVTGMVIELVPSLAEFARAYEESVEQLLRPGTTAGAIIGFVAVAIMAPVCEEAFFRGSLLTAQRTGPGDTFNLVVVNGVLFAAMHLNAVSFVALIPVGIFFAHLTLLTRSLWPPIFAHAALNTVNGIIAPLMLRDSGTDLIEPTMAELAMGAAVTIPFVVALWVYGARRIASPQPG